MNWSDKSAHDDCSLRYDPSLERPVLNSSSRNVPAPYGTVSSIFNGFYQCRDDCRIMTEVSIHHSQYITSGKFEAIYDGTRKSQLPGPMQHLNGKTLFEPLRFLASAIRRVIIDDYYLTFDGSLVQCTEKWPLPVTQYRPFHYNRE